MTLAVILCVCGLVFAFLFIYHSPSLNIKVLLFFIKPRKPFAAYEPPPAPDYSRLENWAEHPLKTGDSHLVPKRSTLQINMDNAKSDVFFVHFTTCLSRSCWNADLADRSLNKITDALSIRNQASLFNESCRVFAPRYRQATLYSFFDQKGNGQKALDLAYEDVKAAFSYYLAHHNQGRPIIMAGHSQGTEHTARLLRDFFDGKELRRQLVVAYLPGMPLKKDLFKDIPLGSSPGQTGCFATWSTFGRGAAPNYFQEAHRQAACTNPLSWRTDDKLEARDRHLGGVSCFFRRVDPHLAEAQCAGGILWVSRPKKIGYLSLPPKNYVLMDYNLFYMNVRENVKLRLENYLGHGEA